MARDNINYELNAYSLNVRCQFFPELSLDYVSVSNKIEMLPEGIILRKGKVAWEKFTFWIFIQPSSCAA